MPLPDEPDLRERLRAGALAAGMTEEEASRATEEALLRLSWRLRRGGKECSSCHETKPVRDYGRDGSRRDGLEPRCRECRSPKG